MEKVTETWVTAPRRPTSVACREACLVHIYPTGSVMGRRYSLQAAAIVVGRGEDCNIQNQRSLLEFLDRELARSARHQRPLALILCDIDWFKTINDELGHLGGDFTLRELAACVKTTVRREDLFARYGGEEFALVLVETSQEGAAEVAERIRQSVEKHPFRFEEKPFSLTISLGVAFT